MKREWLKALNIVTIPIAFILIIVTYLHIITGLLSLIAVFPFYYFLALFYINIRVAVLGHVNSRRGIDMPIDRSGERELKTVTFVLFTGVVLIGVASCILLLNSYWILAGLMFLLIGLLLAFFIEISYRAEYYASKKIRVNYTNIIMAIAMSSILGAFVFIYMYNQFTLYILGISLIFLIFAAYFRIKKTVGFLIYVKNTPANAKNERYLSILSITAFFIGIGAYVLGSLFIWHTVGISELGILAIQLAIVVISTKAIVDIS